MMELLADAAAEDFKAWAVLIIVPTVLLITFGIILEFYWTRGKAWREGKTLVGALVQANTILFSHKSNDAPAMLLVSFKSPGGVGLEELAERMMSLKEGRPRNAAERTVAKLVRNENYLPWRRSLLPREFTDGKEVYAVGVMIIVNLLPERRLTGRSLILKAFPGSWGRVFLAESQVRPTRKRKPVEDLE